MAKPLPTPPLLPALSGRATKKRIFFCGFPNNVYNLTECSIYRIVFESLYRYGTKAKGTLYANVFCLHSFIIKTQKEQERKNLSEKNGMVNAPTKDWIKSAKLGFLFNIKFYLITQDLKKWIYKTSSTMKKTEERGIIRSKYLCIFKFFSGQYNIS